MRIVMHIPTDEGARAALRETAARVHAEAAIRRVERMAASRREKIRLLEELVKPAEAAGETERACRPPVSAT